MKIIVDAMGGDNAPFNIIEGSVSAARDFGVDVVLVGKKDVIRAELDKYSVGTEKISIIDASEVIETGDDPTVAIKKKKNSSIVVGLTALAEGAGDAFVSAGNTGALVSGATLIAKRIKGVRRAALAPVMPTQNGRMLLLDVGATSECTPQFLVQFAVMGSVYMSKVFDIPNPSVGLVNIGTEDSKGTDLVIKTNKLLKNIDINYVGNVEARDIPFGVADVVVCDGFTGNVILKLTEGLGLALYGNIKEIFKKNAISMFSAMLVKGGLKEFKKKMDYTEYGGSPLLGISKPVIKAHGSSDAKAFYHAVRQAVKFKNSGVIEDITQKITKTGVDTDE